MKRNTKLIILILSIVVIVCVVAVVMITGITKGESEYDKHITESQKYLDELDYERAIAELELAIEIEPNNAQAYIALAEVYVELGDNKSAIIVLGEAKEKVKDIAKIDDVLKNLLTETISLDNGEIYVIEYNELGRRIKETHYDSKGNLLRYILRESDEDDNTIKTIQYDGNNRIVWIAEYDKRGNFILDTTYDYDDEGNVEFYWIGEYEDGNRVKSSCYYANGVLNNVAEYDHSKSEYHPVKVTSYMEDGRYFVEDRDTNGNAVKSMHYDPDGNLESFVIFEYDANGNQVKAWQYDANETLTATW